MPQNIFRMTNDRLQPAQYPADARKSNGKFGASLQFFAGQAIGRKTSDGLLYPCSAGKNTVYAITPTGTATAGTFYVRFINANGNEVATTALAYNASIATIQTALDVASGVANGVVASSAGSAAPFSTGIALTLTYSGTGYAALHQPAPSLTPLPPNPYVAMTGVTAITITETIPNNVQTITVGSTLTAGGVSIKILRPTGIWGSTGVVAYNASLATWQTALDIASGVANGVVATSAGSAAPFSSATALVLTFSGTGYAGLSQTLVQFDQGTDVTYSGTVGLTIADSTYTADGTQKCVGFAEFSFSTDANSVCFLTTVAAANANTLLTVGAETMGYFTNGTFLVADLIGWNTSYLADLNGKLMGPSGVLVRFPQALAQFAIKPAQNRRLAPNEIGAYGVEKPQHGIRFQETVMPYIFPTNYELNFIAPALIARMSQDRLGMKIMPMRDVPAAVVEWEQKDNFNGLQQLRGLDGSPSYVKPVGKSRYAYEPGMFGEASIVGENELTKRAGAIADITHLPIPVGDLVLERQEQLTLRELDRIESIIWTLLTTGTFSVSATSGVVFTDTFAIQTYSRAVAWTTLATATPLVDLRALSLLGRGKGANFGAQARAYANKTTINALLGNANASDLAGRRMAVGATFNSLADVNKILLEQNVPSFEEYDEGYYDLNNQFQLFIPDGKVVVLGKRAQGQLIGEYVKTLNAVNPGRKPGSYSFVNDFTGDAIIKRVPPSLEVHQGHNGGPVIYYPGSVCVLSVF